MYCGLLQPLHAHACPSLSQNAWLPSARGGDSELKMLEVMESMLEDTHRQLRDTAAPVPFGGAGTRAGAGAAAAGGLPSQGGTTAASDGAISDGDDDDTLSMSEGDLTE
jgi:hypothetical protein